jgi:ATP-dependent RNA helicase DDX51/DBP6
MVATLPWQQVPIHIQPGTSVRLEDVKGLDPRLLAALRNGSGFQELLPVQAVAWTQLAAGLSNAHDLCIAAPTGSGKTLAYALPVINGLAR